MKCQICDNPAKPIKNCKTVFNKTCGSKECKIELKKLTNIRRYGHSCSLHGINKEKNLASLQEKYGKHITNISQLDYVKEKKIQTCKQNFNVEHPMQSRLIMNKSKQTLLQKYGVDNISKNPEIIKKLRDHWFIIDPISGKRKVDLKMEKVISIMREQYGVDHYFQTDEFKQKSAAHFIRKFGVNNIRKSTYFRDLMIEKGFWYSDTEKDDRWKYYNEVLKYTNLNYKKYFNLLCTTYVRSMNYHLDHIYSIYEGFNNKIDPEIIGSIFNLQILPSKINIIKGKKCWITKEELINTFNNSLNPLTEHI